MCYEARADGREFRTFDLRMMTSAKTQNPCIPLWPLWSHARPPEYPGRRPVTLGDARGAMQDPRGLTQGTPVNAGYTQVHPKVRGRLGKASGSCIAGAGLWNGIQARGVLLDRNMYCRAPHV